MSSSKERQRDVFGYADFTRFWTAETVSGFGSYITTMSLQVLVVLTLHGTAGDIGFLNASRWMPYLLLGLVVGALVDRRRRRPILVATDFGRAVLLGAIPLLWIFDKLNLPILMVFMVAFGTMSLFSDAAARSLLPRLVPRNSLLAANARLDQSSSVAQTSGPLLAGGLVTALGAPVAVLVDAVSYLVSGFVVASIKTPETVQVADDDHPQNLRREIREGLRWIYRHKVMAPLALSTHGWFLFNSILTTIFVPFALLSLNFSAFELGVTLAATGVGGLLGSLNSTRVGLRFGAGRTVIACRALYPLAWAVIVLVPAQSDTHSHVLAVSLWPVDSSSTGCLSESRTPTRRDTNRPSPPTNFRAE